MFGRLRPLYFFAALAFGLLFCYIMSPKPTVIVKFPTPYNAGEVTYVDPEDAETCYKYSAENVTCPFDKTKIRMQPPPEIASNH